MKSRRTRAALAAVAGGSLAAWLLLDPLRWPVRVLATFLLVPLPVILLLQARLVQELPEEAEREAVYFSSAVSIWILAALAMLASRFGGVARADLGLVPLPLGQLLTASAVTMGSGLLIMALGKMLRLRENEMVHYLIPETGSEKIAFAGLSISAGIAEELVFRSFLLTAVLIASGSTGVAVAVSVGAFAVSHAYQGWSGVTRVVILGLILTAPFLLTGSIYPSMIAHAGLDIVAGLVLADWLRNDPSSH